MPSYSYPVRLEPASTLTPEQVHTLLANPITVAHRMASLVTDRFLADFLLPNRYSATGTGAVVYETTGDQVLLANDEPAVIAAGAEYPLSMVNRGGQYASISTIKRGLDSEVYDERIARGGLDPVNKTMRGLGNSLVKQHDRLGLAAIVSKATRTYDVSADGGNFTTAEGIINAALFARVWAEEQGLDSYDYSTVLLKPRQYAKIQSMLLGQNINSAAGVGPVLKTTPIDVEGLTFVTSPNAPFVEPTLIDRFALGGIVDEDLGSPGYVRANTNGSALTTGGNGNDAPGTFVETKIQRLIGSDDRDGYRLRVRRVSVPLVTDSNAAIRLTSTGV